MSLAAEQLYIAQPALGMQLKQLEKDLGVTLLVRHRRGVTPTRAGQLLYERACEALKLVNDIERDVVAAARMEHEGIVLGMANSFSNICGWDLLQETAIKLPETRLSLMVERSVILADQLENHQIDIALSYEAHERSGLVRIPLVEEDMLFVAAIDDPRFAKDKATTMAFSKLTQFPLVLPGDRDGVRFNVLEAAKQLGCELQVQWDISSTAMVRKMVASGAAASVIPYGIVAEDLQHRKLRAWRIVDPPLKRNLYLIRSRTRKTYSTERALLEILLGAADWYADRLGSLAVRQPVLSMPTDQVFKLLIDQTPGQL